MERGKRFSLCRGEKREKGSILKKKRSLGLRERHKGMTAEYQSLPARGERERKKEDFKRRKKRGSWTLFGL